MKRYDLTVIGSGPGGYAACVRAADLGANVALIEKELPGGTCLNWGCIPTKAIIASVKVLYNIKKAPEFGIDVKEYSADIGKIFDRKNDIVLKLRTALESVLKSKGIDIIKGNAGLLNANTVTVEGDSISSKYIILATGSVPAELNNIKLDHNYILSSRDMLDTASIPESIAIIGGGAIGCEFASIYNQLGSKVTLIELLGQLLPNEDEELARRLESNFKKSGIDVIKNSGVSSVNVNNSVRLNLEMGGSVSVAKALLCIGSRPYTEGLNLEKAGIKTESGNILVDKNLKTNIANIYAIGDVIGGYRLAHVASYEGALAADNIFGASSSPADYSCVPSCIFTYPEIGTIGITEKKAKEQGLKFLVTKLALGAISKAHTLGETEGFIKLVNDSQTGRILGAQIFGASATEIIAEFAIAMKNNITVKELGEVIYAHPTLSEGIMDLARRAEAIKRQR